MEHNCNNYNDYIVFYTRRFFKSTLNYIKTFLTTAKAEHVLLISLVCLFFVYGYYLTIIHGTRMLMEFAWREADSLSLALNYYKENLNFFTPKVNFSGYGKGEGYAIGEFPIVYYIVSKLWKLYGQHEFIFYATSMTIVWIGLLYLCKLSFSILQDRFWAVFISLFLYSSPLLAFQAWSSVPHAAAFGILWAGIYYYYLYCREAQTKHLIAFTLIFALVGGVKIVFLSFPLAILITQILFFTYGSKPQFFKTTNLKKIIAAASVISIAAYSYIKYCKWFIKQQEHLQFALHIEGKTFLPESTRPDLNYIVYSLWDHIKDTLPHTFSNSYFLYGFLGSVVLLIPLSLFRRVNRELLIISIIIVLGVMTNIMLWPYYFQTHQYYSILTLCALPFPLLTILVYFKDTCFSAVFKNKYIKFVFMGLLLAAIVGTSVQNRAKYYRDDYFVKKFPSLIQDKRTGETYRTIKAIWSYNDYYNQFDKGYGSITPYLRFLGIERTDKVIVIQGRIPNMILYLMDQKGFPIIPNIDEMRKDFPRALDKGAKYMLSNKKHEDIYLPFKEHIDRELAREYMDIKIFKLKDVPKTEPLDNGNLEKQ